LALINDKSSLKYDEASSAFVNHVLTQGYKHFICFDDSKTPVVDANNFV